MLAGCRLTHRTSSDGSCSRFCLLDRTVMSRSSLPRSKPVDIPSQVPSQSSPSLTENDSPAKPASSSPREIVRRVVERTSDKLGRSKSVGSKSQHSPKPQYPSPHGSPKRFMSQSRKGKELQTASTGDLQGTWITYHFCTDLEPRPAHVIGGAAAVQVADNDTSSTSPSPDTSPSKQGMCDESPFIRPSSPIQPRPQLSPPTFQGDTSAGVL